MTQHLDKVSLVILLVILCISCKERNEEKLFIKNMVFGIDYHFIDYSKIREQSFKFPPENFDIKFTLVNESNDTIKFDFQSNKYIKGSNTLVAIYGKDSAKLQPIKCELDLIIEDEQEVTAYIKYDDYHIFSDLFDPNSKDEILTFFENTSFVIDENQVRVYGKPIIEYYFMDTLVIINMNKIN
jgi:hypothetical protein